VTVNLYPGLAFLVPSGPRQLLHLHVILTAEDEDGLHLATSFSSIKDGVEHDRTCETKADEHKFLTKPSFVLYAFTTTFRAKHIKAMIEKNYYQVQPDLSEELYARVCDGVLKSDRTPRGMKKYFNQ
jgi:hypothetical protein